ncbi:hypothetical protein CVT26_003975 [Gymnopilus dilepis]|uniref:Uncharacterized protein n=1 Tax=Gymnopilus dilepis TaxID=231916 RepID=A0A409WYJ8_9AGAR|nr:hypothetical protein CVT26_003975 [Gymnopilus dilepis]
MGERNEGKIEERGGQSRIWEAGRRVNELALKRHFVHRDWNNWGFEAVVGFEWHARDFLIQTVDTALEVVLLAIVADEKEWRSLGDLARQAM